MTRNCLFTAALLALTGCSHERPGHPPRTPNQKLVADHLAQHVENNPDVYIRSFVEEGDLVTVTWIDRNNIQRSARFQVIWHKGERMVVPPEQPVPPPLMPTPPPPPPPAPMPYPGGR
jgi:hypothetical protein